MKMSHLAHLSINKDTVESLQRSIDVPFAPDMGATGTLWEDCTYFRNGSMVKLHVQQYQGTCYAQAVLFNKDGQEQGRSKVHSSLVSAYEVIVDIQQDSHHFFLVVVDD